MSNYNELSRRGLIKLNNDFDTANNNALKEFLNNSEDVYEGIRPHEHMIEKLDETAERVKIQGGIVSTAVIKRMDKIFDHVMDKLSEEVNRACAIIDEQMDDSAYPSDMDDEDSDEEDDSSDEVEIINF